MELLQRYKEHVKKEQLFAANDHLLLAVSGGLDSVVLTELCRQAGYHFSIVHCNFLLRGEESERDEAFVRQLADKYQAPFYLRRFNTEEFATQHKLSIQEAARQLRYSFFEELILQQTASDSGLSTIDSRLFLLTAHHQDDNIETLLMNFLRGTGLHGLTGIPAKNNHIRRPLLPFSRKEIAAFAKAEGLSFVEDSSNLSSKYTRNYLRNEWIPALEEIYPQVRQNLSENIERFKAIERLYQQSLQTTRKKLLTVKGEEVHIPVNLLMKYDNSALIYELIAPYGFSEKQIDEIIKLANSPSGKYIDAPTGKNRIIRHRRWFIIAPVQTEGAVNIVIEKGEKQVYFEGGHIDLVETNVSQVSPDASVACIDSAAIEFPLLLRKIKTGDYFYPLGMKKKKKISRFLIDLKLSKTQKENAWVVESAGRIIWVVGQRIDERVKVTPATKKMLKLTLS